MSGQPLDSITEYCDQRLNTGLIADFPGAYNGLQFANRGQITKIGAAVDAGLIPFQKAAQAGVNLLLVHHGLFWSESVPVTGNIHARYKTLIEHDIAVYGAHLPLDAHPELGNNAQLARLLQLPVVDWFLEYQGNPMAALCRHSGSRADLARALQEQFPHIFAIEFGSTHPKRVAILTGSGRSAIPHLKSVGADTLITGELRQENFNTAQELGLNLYACGHYATEVFGVKALAAELAEKFDLPWEFIPTECPL